MTSIWINPKAAQTPVQDNISSESLNVLQEVTCLQGGYQRKPARPLALKLNDYFSRQKPAAVCLSLLNKGSKSWGTHESCQPSVSSSFSLILLA